MKILLALLVLSGSAIGLSAPASARQDTFCLQGRIWGYPGNCQFSTYEQCQATASGTDAYCGVNPRAAFAGVPDGPTRYRGPVDRWQQR
jgi:hypothetical protein